MYHFWLLIPSWDRMSRISTCIYHPCTLILHRHSLDTFYSLLSLLSTANTKYSLTHAIAISYGSGFPAREGCYIVQTVKLIVMSFSPYLYVIFILKIIVWNSLYSWKRRTFFGTPLYFYSEKCNCIASHRILYDILARKSKTYTSWAVTIMCISFCENTVIGPTRLY